MFISRQVFCGKLRFLCSKVRNGRSKLSDIVDFGSTS